MLSFWLNSKKNNPAYIEDKYVQLSLALPTPITTIYQTINKVILDMESHKIILDINSKKNSLDVYNIYYQKKYDNQSSLCPPSKIPSINEYNINLKDVVQQVKQDSLIVCPYSQIEISLRNQYIFRKILKYIKFKKLSLFKSIENGITKAKANMIWKRKALFTTIERHF
jgi:hypothetical protein